MSKREREEHYAQYSGSQMCMAGIVLLACPLTFIFCLGYASEAGAAAGLQVFGIFASCLAVGVAAFLFRRWGGSAFHGALQIVLSFAVAATLCLLAYLLHSTAAAILCFLVASPAALWWAKSSTNKLASAAVAGEKAAALKASKDAFKKSRGWLFLGGSLFALSYLRPDVYSALSSVLPSFLGPRICGTVCLLIAGRYATQGEEAAEKVKEMNKKATSGFTYAVRIVALVAAACGTYVVLGWKAAAIVGIALIVYFAYKDGLFKYVTDEHPEMTPEEKAEARAAAALLAGGVFVAGAATAGAVQGGRRARSPARRGR